MQMNLYTIIPEKSEGSYIYVITNTFSEAENYYLSLHYSQKINIMKRHYVILPDKIENIEFKTINLYKVIMLYPENKNGYIYVCGRSENDILESYDENNKQKAKIEEIELFLKDVVIIKKEE